jgi:Asp-tRNA(Asn)/Glu-tRNA(Gln) amidotransferase A subunit family amidase
VTTVAAIYLGKNWYQTTQSNNQLKAAVTEKIQVRNAKRKEFQEYIQRQNSESTRNDNTTSNAKDKIKSMTATELRESIQSGKLQVSDVVRVFCERAAAAGDKFNLITEEFYFDALKQAIEMDSLGAKAPTKNGLLFGVPISVKDQIHQQSSCSSCGIRARALRTSQADGILVELLRDQGAIPLMRGNTPQCLMLPESDNNVWGRSDNPWNPSCTCGGSTGGDGGLVACQAAPIAIGTDIGGSLRIPAHFNGVYGMKPTSARITSQGIAVPRPGDVTGQQAIVSAAGPMANCTDDLVRYLQLSNILCSTHGF